MAACRKQDKSISRSASSVIRISNIVIITKPQKIRFFFPFVEEPKISISPQVSKYPLCSQKMNLFWLSIYLLMRLTACIIYIRLCCCKIHQASNYLLVKSTINSSFCWILLTLQSFFYRCNDRWCNGSVYKKRSTWKIGNNIRLICWFAHEFQTKSHQNLLIK